MCMPSLIAEHQSPFTVCFGRPGENVDTSSCHLHIGACLPHTQWVAGALPLHLQVQKHQCPDMNVSVTIEVFLEWVGGNATLRLMQNKALSDCALR
jgi:hypothetical protein